MDASAICPAVWVVGVLPVHDEDWRLVLEHAQELGLAGAAVVRGSEELKDAMFIESGRPISAVRAA
jgi:hypothetical protein